MSETVIKVSMKGLANSSVLAGATNGTLLLGKMLAEVNEPPRPAPVFIDFAGVDVATASFLRESLLRFRDHVRGKRSTIYPVVANANEDIIDDLHVLIGATGSALLTCRLSSKGRVCDPKLIGSLDPKQQMTFDLVNSVGETDAGTLMREHNKSEGVGQTAWNNRLAMLASLGLILELSQGRAKRYRPLFAEIQDGN